MIVYLTLVTLITSSGKHQSDNINSKHAAHSGENNIVSTLSKPRKFCPHLFKVDWVWRDEEVSTKRSQVITIALDSSMNRIGAKLKEIIMKFLSIGALYIATHRPFSVTHTVKMFMLTL